VGMPVLKPGSISPVKLLGGIDMRLGWVSDHPSAA
jgi:hypothetical protein